MANIKGGRAARKRDRQNAKARARNTAVKATADRKKSRAQLKLNKMAKAAEAAK